MVDLDLMDEVVIERIKSGVMDLKNVETYEGEFDETDLKRLGMLAPFALIRFTDLGALTDQRNSSGEAIIKGLRMLIVIGAKSVRSKRDAQKGNYRFAREIDALLDGKRFTISDQVLPAFEFERYKFAFSYQGTTVYFLTYTMSII